MGDGARAGPCSLTHMQAATLPGTVWWAALSMVTVKRKYAVCLYAVPLRLLSVEHTDPTVAPTVYMVTFLSV